MKKPIALWVAPPLLLLNSATIFYRVNSGSMAPRFQRNTAIVALILAVLAVILYFKPKIGRWPAGAYYFLTTWIAVGAAVKPEARPKDAAVAWLSAALGCWLAYALLGSKKTKAFLDGEAEPNQPPQRNAGSRPFSDDSSASETPSSPGPRG